MNPCTRIWWWPPNVTNAKKAFTENKFIQMTLQEHHGQLAAVIIEQAGFNQTQHNLVHPCRYI